MKKIKLEDIGFECELDENVLNDWRYMDFLTRSEDPEFKSAERFRAMNKAIELLLGMAKKEELLAKIAEKNNNHVEYVEVYNRIAEIGNLLSSKNQKK